MSTIPQNEQFTFDNSNENYLTSNEQSYVDLIDFCSLRKQFTRIIPSCYVEITKKFKSSKHLPTQNLEEYRKLKEEIILMQESIELLRESKQKKLREIDELRCLMRKVANKEINMKEKEFISNNFNYCQREISTPPEKLPLDSEKDNENYICSSLQPTASEMSEGKDDDERFSFNSKRILIQDSNN